jgi:hypothetical protein
MGHPSLFFAILAALVLGAFTRLDASSTKTDDLASLCKAAERICEVEVLSKESVQLNSGTIETRYTFATLLPMKGTMGSVQQITIPGGAVAGRGLAIPGMPRLEVGERHILFLSAVDEQQWRMPVGLDAGAFLVRAGQAKKSVVGAASCCDQDGHSDRVQSYDRFVQRIFAELE